MTPCHLRLPQLPQPSHWFPVLALGGITMVMEKQSRKNNCGRRTNGDEVMFVGFSTLGLLKGGMTGFFLTLSPYFPFCIIVFY